MSTSCARLNRAEGCDGLVLICNAPSAGVGIGIREELLSRGSYSFFIELVIILEKILISIL